MNKDTTLNLDESIQINHNLTLPETQYVYDIFRQHLPYNFSWDGNISQLMYINYLRSTNPIVDMEIKPTSIYPSAEIFIEAVLEKNLMKRIKLILLMMILMNYHKILK